MKKSQAIQYSEYLLKTLQKFRSNAAEDLPEDIQHLLPSLYPWTKGPNNILQSLTDWLDRAAAGKEITPMEFYNWMVIAHLREPMIAACSLLINGNKGALPEPNVHWVMGWDPE